MQKMNDAVLTTCPECGKETFAKQLSAAGFQLKGSGWYATDFKGGSKPKEESSSSTAESKPASCASDCACH
jgi:predicted nucleic acid-binding Zn ribbon protein